MLNFRKRISLVCRSCYYHIRDIRDLRRLRRCLTESDLEYLKPLQQRCFQEN